MYKFSTTEQTVVKLPVQRQQQPDELAASSCSVDVNRLSATVKHRLKINATTFWQCSSVKKIVARLWAPRVSPRR